MIIDGQKWACEACVRGHRVSTCKHHDRPLIRINKKGRPFAVCSICHSSPCKAPEEHAKLRREAEMQSSKKATSRRPAGTTFVPIAPRPTNPSSPAEQSQTAGNPLAGNASSRASSQASSQPQPKASDLDSSVHRDLSTSGTTEPFQTEALAAPTLSSMSISPLSPFPSGYPTDSQMSEEFSFPDNAFDCLEDMDAEPDDWSFLWSGDPASWEWRYPDPSSQSYDNNNER